MPMPTVYSNKIFSPESGMFSWQKYIDANKDTATQQAKDYNTALDTKFAGAQQKAQEVQSKLSSEKQDIADIKKSAKSFVSPSIQQASQQTTPLWSVDGDNEQASATFQNVADPLMGKVKEVAKSGYTLDSNRYKEPLAQVAKDQADLSAANRISGRMGVQGTATPAMSSYADQVLLQQGGAGQGYESKASELQKTLDLINAGQTDVSTQAGALQGDVQDTLATGLKTLEPIATKNAIQAGKAKVSNLQNKDMNYQKSLGAMLPTLLKGGVDASQFIKKPELTDEDYLNYGYNDETEKVDEIRDMLGQSTLGGKGLKDVSIGWDTDAAKSKYNFLKDLELSDKDARDQKEAGDLVNKINNGIGTMAPAGFASSTIAGPAIAGPTNKFDENKDYLRAPSTDKDKFKEKNYRFQNLLRGV